MHGHGQDSLLRSITVVTPENLEIRYRLAGPASRGLAWSFDSLFQALVIALLLVLVSAVGSVVSFTPLGEASGPWVVGVQVLLVFLVTNGYFIYFEMRWNGQTPGKRLLHLRVIREGGYPISGRESVIRNLLRIVDWMPLFYALGMLSSLLSPSCRRLGDFAAGTYVVLEEPPLKLEIPASTTYLAAANNLEADRLDLLRTFFLRSRWLIPRHRAAIAKRLAEKLAAELALEVPLTRSSEGFLADLLSSALKPPPAEAEVIELL